MAFAAVPPPGGTLFLSPAQRYRDDPRRKLIETLVEGASATTPVQSHWEGLARVAKGAAAGLIQRNLAKETRERGEGARRTLAEALAVGQDRKETTYDPEYDLPTGERMVPGDPEKMIQILGGNEDTAGLAAQFQLGRIGAREQLALGLEKSRAERQAKREDERKTQLSASDLAALGLPAGTIAQRDAYGGLQVVHQPDKPVAIPEGGALFDPRTGRRVADNPGGPFRGTGMDQQAWALLSEGAQNPAIRTTPQYAAAYAHLSQPRVNFDPASGQAVQIVPQIPFPPPTAAGAPGATAQTSPAPPPAPPQGGASTGVSVAPVGPPKLTMDESMKLSNLSQATRDVDAVINTMMDEGGRIKPGARDLLFSSGKIAGVEGIPFTDGRQMRQQARRAVEVLLRLRTGAAAPESEVNSYMNQFFPRLGDTDAQIGEKLGAMRALFSEAHQMFTQSRPGLPPLPQRPGATPPASRALPPGVTAESAIAEARAAIAAGKSPTAVKARLREMGIDPTPLEAGEPPSVPQFQR